MVNTLRNDINRLDKSQKKRKKKFSNTQRKLIPFY